MEPETQVTEQPVDPAVVENALAAEAPPAADPPVTDPVAAEPAETTPEPDKDHGNKGKSPWYMRRIAEEADRARAAEEESKNLKAMLDRMQTGDKPADKPTQPAPTQDVDAIVAQRIAQRDLQRDSNDILEAGRKDYGPQFNETVRLAQALGVVSDDIVLDLAAVDKANAHKILTALTTNPDIAERVSRVNPRQRLVELTRLSMAVSSPAHDIPAKPAAPAAKVSKAPAPPPPVEPSVTKEVNWRSDKASDAEFNAGWSEMMKNRNGRRR